MPLTAVHSGKLGDIIFSLPTVRQLEIKTFFVRHGIHIGEREAENILDLLRLQPYLERAEIYQGEPVDVDLDHFRDFAIPYPTLHLVQCHWSGVGGQDALNISPWLTVPPAQLPAPVVVNRCLRAQALANWEWLRPMPAMFVGLPEEYTAFEQACGFSIPHHPTPTVLDFAAAIAGASLYIGNQSLGMAIAEALDKPRKLEVYWPHPCGMPLTERGTFINDREGNIISSAISDWQRIVEGRDERLDEEDHNG
jgi:hypothetical protein